MSVQWPILEDSLITNHFYEIDGQGKWVMQSAQKRDHRIEEWTSRGKTNLLLATVDERIQKLGTSIVQNTDACNECKAHIDNLVLLQKHVLRKVKAYYENSHSFALINLIWRVIGGFVYAVANTKFEMRLTKLKTVLPKEPQPAPAERANPNLPPVVEEKEAYVDDRKNDVVAEAPLKESVEDPTSWANYQRDVHSKLDAERFLTDNAQPNILWQDSADSTYYFSHKKANEALAHVKVFGFYLNLYQEPGCKVNYKMKNTPLNAANVQALRDKIVQVIESAA